ncbi:DUF1758 domain-containing protein [Trichonephila clavata]|uniref:DUF1758 domain-containing protein n=1 Tax=Trichonephila clavata TaxID=2740835 RepID=A0A8X6HQE5_TRICU|nr:DUF1758 domain-containing protein [Trichonephila clavata]
MDDKIQKIEVSLKPCINKLNTCNFSVSSDCLNDNYRPKKASIKLPEIPLPIFNSKFEEWNIFNGQFETLIHKNPELSESDKLFYLRGSIRGDAKTIETSDDNYISLLKALEQRYENRRIIVGSHIKNILNYQAVRHESSKNLRY